MAHELNDTNTSAQATVTEAEVRAAMGTAPCPICARICKRYTNFRLQAHHCTSNSPLRAPESSTAAFHRALRNARLMVSPPGETDPELPAGSYYRFLTDDEIATTP